MALKKHYLGHSAGDEVRWLKDGRLSGQTGTLKGYDESTLEWVISTGGGTVRADLVSDEKERVAFWKAFEEANKRAAKGSSAG